MNDQNIINKFETNYNLSELKRIIKKSTNTQLPIIRAKTNNIDMYNKILKEGIKIGYTIFRTEAWIFEPKVLQCYKCNKLNHSYKNCSELESCAFCTGSHNFKNCPDKTKLKCTNCGEAHASFSKLCNKLKPVIVNKPIQKIYQNNNFQNTNFSSIIQNKPRFLSNPTIVPRQIQNTHDKTVFNTNSNLKNDQQNTDNNQRSNFKKILSQIITTITSLLNIPELDMSSLIQIQQTIASLVKRINE